MIRSSALLFGWRTVDKVRAVNLHVARELAWLPLLRFDRLAQLVRQDEGRLVLAIEIAGELERAVALRAVDENRDGE